MTIILILHVAEEFLSHFSTNTIALWQVLGLLEPRELWWPRSAAEPPELTGELTPAEASQDTEEGQDSIVGTQAHIPVPKAYMWLYSSFWSKL